MPNTQVLEKSAQFNWLSNKPSRLVLTSLILFGALSYLEFLMEMIQYISTLESCQATPVSSARRRTEKSPVHPRLVSTSLVLTHPHHLVVGGCHSFCFLNPSRRGHRDFAQAPTSPIIIDSLSRSEAETSPPPSSHPHHREERIEWPTR